MSDLKQVFEHDVKQTILKTYQSMIQYKFKLYQEQRDNVIKEKLETEIYELIHTLQEMICK
jgi:hypothetical protein